MNLNTLKKAVAEMAVALTPELIKIRHQLHQNPELGRQEKKTSAYLARLLAPLNMELAAPADKTGLWADLVSDSAKPFLALRCDIDALPIVEKNATPYVSKNHGIMHACGHDAHTAVLAGTAMILSHLRDQLDGNVRFVFQPAEEVTPGGAIDMIERGALDRVESILTLHSDPRIPVGHIGVKFGPFLASTDIFKIRILGKGAHAANPHKSIDPILISAQLINALNHLVSRDIDPVIPAVLTVTRIHGGTAINIIPDEVEIWGTMRALDSTTREFLQKRLQEITAGICRMHDAKFDLTLDKGAPPVINDTALGELLFDAAADILGSDKAIKLERPDMGAEDFAWYLQKVPGAVFRLGTHGRPGTDFELHHPNFDIDDDALAVGVKVFCQSVFQYFAGR